METATKTPVVVYAESTPNPSAMKFVANKLLVPAGNTYEFKDFESTKSSPFAQQLFRFSFVKNVFISGNYVTINKVDGIEWEEVMGHIREFIKMYIEDGGIIIKDEKSASDISSPKVSADLTHHSAPGNTIEEKIVGILEEYIRPAVEQDGGLISFKSFNEGLVTVVLKGSCSGCPSSTITLKAGIEALLKRMVPEVKEVVAEQA